MRVASIALAIFGAMLGSSEAVAVTYSSSPFSKVIATARLPYRDNPEVYFTVRAGALWSGGVDLTTAGDGFYYQYSGTVELKIGMADTILYAGDGLFLPARTKFTLMKRMPPSDHQHTYSFCFHRPPNRKSQISRTGSLSRSIVPHRPFQV